MIIVDTSVWIDYFRGANSWQAQRLDELIVADEAIGLTDIVFTEIMRGIRHEPSVKRVERRLLAHEVFFLDPLDDHRRAAGLYRTCRRRGVTVRRTLDCLIAAVCIREQVPLLHADADFNRLSSHTELRVVDL